jgi:hypothetical protein
LREEVESSKEAQKEETKKLGGAALIDFARPAFFIPEANPHRQY